MAIQFNGVPRSISDVMTDIYGIIKDTEERLSSASSFCHRNEMHGLKRFNRVLSAKFHSLCAWVKSSVIDEFDTVLKPYDGGTPISFSSVSDYLSKIMACAISDLEKLKMLNQEFNMITGFDCKIAEQLKCILVHVILEKHRRWSKLTPDKLYLHNLALHDKIEKFEKDYHIPYDKLKGL